MINCLNVWNRHLTVRVNEPGALAKAKGDYGDILHNTAAS